MVYEKMSEELERLMLRNQPRGMQKQTRAAEFFMACDVKPSYSYKKMKLQIDATPFRAPTHLVKRLLKAVAKASEPAYTGKIKWNRRDKKYELWKEGKITLSIKRLEGPRFREAALWKVDKYIENVPERLLDEKAKRLLGVP